MQNREGRTKYMQAIRDGEVQKPQWMKEEKDGDYNISKIRQEFKLDDDKIQYRCQFVGFKKLADARWWSKEEMEMT